MNTNSGEFPKHPVPQVPQPQDPQRVYVQSPTVFVYEKNVWEYRVISKKADQPLTVEELNALGRDGWELAGVANLDRNVQFYFKRVRS